MNKTFVKDVDVRGKLVFLRNDFNVPLDKQQVIADDTRIRESLPTFEYLLGQGARVVCCSHLGRPKGEVIPDCTLKPVAKRLGELLKIKVQFIGETIGPEVEKAKAALKPGEVLLLENLRFRPGETKNDEAFAKELARGIDVYVDDAFGACHRAHASIAAITRFVPVAACGFLLKKEIEYLSLAVVNPPKKYVLILGGAKVSDKLPVIANLLEKASTMLIGGAMAYTFLKAEGQSVGNSRVEPDLIPTCREILEKARARGVKLLLPIDHIAAFKPEANITLRMLKAGEEIPAEMMGLDIGPETVERYVAEISQAELIVWNGPMGVFEIDSFAGGTMEIARAVAASKAITIIGGGDSVAAVNKAGVAARIKHISTGGGASLEFLAGDKLPGIEALTEA
jgi:phosphoglycerate kinase